VKVIYEPKGPALEYAKLALNIYKGCTHGCVYCYNNGRYSKKGEFFKSARPRQNLMSGLVADCADLQELGDDCPEIQLTFLGDAYQPMEKFLGLTRMAIQTIMLAELPFTILTKSALIDRDFLFFKSYPKFRAGFSFTTIDPIEAKEWEPGCGYVRDRAAVLQKFKSYGIKTWVSLEPVMSVESTIRVIRELNKFVDFFWVGALQHMKPPAPINLVEAHRQIMEVLEYYHSNYRFKHSFTGL
jgi:DNA repair photolyase